MKEKTRYIPYNNWKEFEIIKENNKTFFILHNMLLEFEQEKYVPKAGLLFDEVLQGKCKNKTVLDLGCGPLGILGIIALYNGAKKVLSVDVDNLCVDWLKYIIKENNLLNIKAINSNFFSEIPKNQKFDLILSNPPHMPMLYGKLCDSGGKDGKKYIKKILREGYDFLTDTGELNIMMFDFLGVDRSYNNDISIFEYAKKIGYRNCEIIYEMVREITEGSVTFKNLNYIKKQYPKYPFEDIPTCKILIVKFLK